MRTMVVVVVAAAIGLVLQSTVLQFLGGPGAIPDILLVLCVYLGLRQHSVGGAVGAFLLGYVEDSFSGSTVGLNAFGMCLVFLLVYVTSRRLWVDNLVSKVVVVFLASIVKTAAVTLLLLLFVSSVAVSGELASTVVLQAVMTAAIGPVIFALLMGTEPPEEEEWE